MGGVLQLEALWIRLVASFEATFRFDGILIYVPAVLMVALAIEALCVGYRRSTLANFGKIKITDWFLYIIQQINLNIILGYVATLGIAYVLFSESYALASSIVPEEFRITSAIAYFLAVDCLGYWFHRLSHTVPTLWNLHHVHHSAPEFNIVNSFRSHPVETAISRIFVAIPATALFIPDTSSLGAGALAYFALTKLLNLLQHSKINSGLGWAGKIVVSPAHHRIHHSTNPDHFDRNFGNSLIIWDKLFGTYCTAPRKEIDEIEIGLDDYDKQSGVIAYLWSTYSRFLRGLFSPVTKLLVRRPAISPVTASAHIAPADEAREVSETIG